MPSNTNNVGRGLFVLVLLFAVSASAGRWVTATRIQHRAWDKEDAQACSKICGKGKMVSWDRERGCLCSAQGPGVPVEGWRKNNDG